MSASLDQLTAVVINYDLPDLTVRSVQALIGDGAAAERIVIVDNGSEDVTQLEALLPECPVVALPENVGYAQAANAGASALPGVAYLITNNDAFVHRSGSLAALMGALAEDPQRGIVVPRLRNDDLTLQPTVRPVDTPTVALVRASGFSRFVPNDRQPHWSTHWDHAASREIVAADGAVYLVRAQTWDQLGGFNPDIPMFAEDSDLCWRARRHGWSIWFESDAEFVHLGQATSQRRWSDPSRAFLVGRSEAALLRQELGSISAHLSIGFTVVGLCARWLVFRARHDTRATARVAGELRGYVTGLARVGATVKARRAD